jgi:hypothetical protein
MPTNNFPISLFVKKSVYAKRNITGYKTAGGGVPRYNFAKDAYIGDVYSYATDKKTGKHYLMFYITLYDYDNFIPTFIEIKYNDIKVLGLDDAIKQYDKELQDKKEAEEKEQKGALAYYIEKYVPTALTIFAVGYIGSKLIK